MLDGERPLVNGKFVIARVGTKNPSESCFVIVTFSAEFESECGRCKSTSSYATQWQTVLCSLQYVTALYQHSAMNSVGLKVCENDQI